MLNEALSAYRMACHGATKVSPYQLVYEYPMKRKKKESLRRSWSRRRKRWPWLLEDWGGFCATGFGRKKEFAVKKSRFGVKLNSEKMGDGSAVSRSTRSQL